MITGKPFNSLKKYIALLILAILTIVLLPARQSFANAPVPLYIYQIILLNAPDEAYGVDLLVMEDELKEDNIYTDLNYETLKEAALPPECELTLYNEDGYVSFGCHYSNSSVTGLLTENSYNNWLEAFYSYDDSYDWLTERKEQKIAVYDSSGNILAISDSFSMRGISYRYKGQVTYDLESGDIEIANRIVNNKKQSKPLTGIFPFSCMGRSSSGIITVRAADMETASNIPDSSNVLMLLFLLLRCAVFTAAIELLIALLFRIKPVWKVPLTTFISNIIMNLAIILLLRAGVNYWILLAIGEVLAIVAEMLIYFQLYKDTGRGRIAIFTVVANLASLGLMLAITQLKL